MAKSVTAFVCQNCEASTPKWQGQCGNCGEWNTLVETVVDTKGSNRKRSSESDSLGAQIDTTKVIPFSQVSSTQSSKSRFSSQVGELDRVLGGGMVAGAVMLLGGEPGIGKSTLLTQVVVQLLQTVFSQNDVPTKGKQIHHKKKLKVNNQTKSDCIVMYVCGEESPDQINLRIKRILNNEHSGVKNSSGKDRVKKNQEQLLFVTATDVDQLCVMLQKYRPSVLIVDSIQTMTTSELSGAAGSAGQIRESADRITTIVKQLGIPCFLVGHVTKEGVIAGPKVLEHIVDTVLELSGERTDDLRLLRTLKNRFGPTDEVGVFRHTENGLEEVPNPSQIFLEHKESSVPGSATVCVMEGSRPLLLEVQALVVSSQLAMPRRVGRGIELSRIQVLAAVLQKHCGLPLGSSDIFLSAAGGFKITEPAVDIGLAVAIASSLKNRALPQDMVFIGEVGLLGEMRSVNYLEKRMKEAKRLGYTKIISRKTHKNVRALLKDLKLL